MDLACNYAIFAEEIATGGGEGNCHILLAFFQDIYKGLNTHLHTASEVCGVLLLSALISAGGKGVSTLSERSNIYIHTLNTIFRMKNTLLKDLKALALQGLKQGRKGGEKGRKKAVRGAAKGKAQGTRTGTRTRSGANIINLHINFINAPVSDTHHFYAPVGQVANTMSNNIKEQQKGE